MNEEQDKEFALVLNEQTLPIIEQTASAMPGGFFIYHADANEDLIFVNKALIRIFGCDTLEEFKELTGYTFRGMVHPDDIERTEQLIRKQINENTDNYDYVEYRIARKDGSIRWIRDYGHFVHTEDMGDVFYVFINDATDKYLRQNEEKRKAEVIEGFSRDYNSIYLLDFEKDEIIPYRLQNTISDNVKEAGSYHKFCQEFALSYVVPEDRERYIKESAIAAIRVRLKTEPSYIINFRRYNEKGSVEWEQMFITRIGDKDNCLKAVAGYKTVTQYIKKLQAETAAKIKMEYELNEAKHANQAKSAFLFSISHDIRTPMNAITGFTSLARKYINQADRLTDCLDKVETSSRHLLALINDMLDMGQIESGQIHIKPEGCNLKEQLYIVLEMLSTQISGKKLDFSLETNMTDESIYADPLNLRRIFANVIGNAVKFTPAHGKVSVRVDQGAHAQAGYVFYKFTISDTGIGMSEEFMRHMFEAFEREGTSTKTGYQGTGLGLSITKKLIDMMGGSITATSVKGEGSVFIITLAFKIPDKKITYNAGKFGNVLNKWPEEKLKGKRILLVEDNELNREIATEILTDAGFRIEAVPDGCDAVEAVRNHPAGYFDLVLMDIQMPVMNGYDATRAIRALGREDIKRLPIIALSANAMSEDRRKSIESGMNAHISKPIDITNLICTLKGYMI